MVGDQPDRLCLSLAHEQQKMLFYFLGSSSRRDEGIKPNNYMPKSASLNSAHMPYVTTHLHTYVYSISTSYLHSNLIPGWLACSPHRKSEPPNAAHSPSLAIHHSNSPCSYPNHSIENTHRKNTEGGKIQPRDPDPNDHNRPALPALRFLAPSLVLVPGQPPAVIPPCRLAEPGQRKMLNIYITYTEG